MNKIYDVTIVGAGPAGLSAAICLARQGIKPLVIERGLYPGSKNMFGGVVYGNILQKLVPDFWETAPIERFISRRRITFLSDDSASTYAYYNRNYLIPPYNGFTVIRPHFDKWLAEIAEKHGAVIVNGTTVSNVTYTNDFIRLELNNGQEEICSNVVIAADGINSVVARKSGLRSDFKDTSVAIGVKETLYLPKTEIERRFNLDDKEGHANEFVGFSVNGLKGGGFLYTNSDSISIGIIAQIASLKEKGLSPAHVLDNFKNNSYINGFIKGAKTAEYSAHLIPELGYDSLPKLFGDRLLLTGDAAGFILNTGYNLEGVNYAIGSGIAAADTVLNAYKLNNFSKRTLADYLDQLDRYNILTDFRAFRDASKIIDNPRMHRDYPDFVNNIAAKLFTVDGMTKQKIKSYLNKEVSKLGLRTIVTDTYRAIRGLF